MRAALLAVGLMLIAQSREPLSVNQALLLVPGARLLAETDFADAADVTELKGYGYWPPWLVQDMDGDGRPDVIAVVTRQSPSGRQYGVIAVHAAAPGRVHWIVEFNRAFISGVAKGYLGEKKPRTPAIVIPLFCVDCDSNSWARWSGEAYEWELHSVGERFQVRDGPKDIFPLFAQPSRRSESRSDKACTEVVVREVGGVPRDRWYSVTTIETYPIQGWIPAKFVADQPGDC